MTSNDSRDDDRAFVAQVRDALDANDLSSDVVERLRAARRTAVAAAEVRGTVVVHLPPRWVPMGAMAATVLAAVLLRGPAETPGILFDNELQLAAAQDLELLENLEFAAWMVESDAGDAI